MAFPALASQQGKKALVQQKEGGLNRQLFATDNTVRVHYKDQPQMYVSLYVNYQLFLSVFYKNQKVHRNSSKDVFFDRAS